MWLNIGLSWKINKLCVFWTFFKITLYSAVSFERPRRELSIDVAEHRSILKNKEIMRILNIFQDSPMFGHIIRKVSARAFHWCGWTHRSLLKNDQNTDYPRFSFTPKISLKQVFPFYCAWLLFPTMIRDTFPLGSRLELLGGVSLYFPGLDLKNKMNSKVHIIWMTGPLFRRLERWRSSWNRKGTCLRRPRPTGPRARPGD